MSVEPTLAGWGALMGLLLFLAGGALGFTMLTLAARDWARDRRYARQVDELERRTRALDALASIAQQRRREEDAALLAERLDDAAADEWAQAMDAWRFGA